MSLTTHSKWYYGFTIDSSNSSLDFSEGGSEIQATLRVGSYSASEIAEEVAFALNDVASSETYTVTFDRDTRVFTIAATGNFELLVSTGTRVGTSCFSTIGFTGSDRTGAATYDGNLAAGSEYKTQFILQDYIPSTNSKAANEGTVNISARGEVEVFKFGTKKFMTCSIKYVTNIVTGSHVIRDDASGLDKFIDFMDFIITKSPIEFMPDENDTATFEKMLLETTEKDSKGLGFEIKEMITQKLPGFYESGKLVFRVID